MTGPTKTNSWHCIVQKKETSVDDVAWEKMIISKYKEVGEIIDECYAFKPIVY